MKSDVEIIESYHSFLRSSQFPCIAAKASLAKQQIHTIAVKHMGCQYEDAEVLDFLYQFVDDFRRSKNIYSSATVIYEQPLNLDEEQFDNLMWQRLQALVDLDSRHYAYDNRVSSDPGSSHFSFSLKGEAFFIIALHPNSSRKTRRFSYPALVFNPHEQFEVLRKENRYEAMKKIVRKRDLILSGSVNPMLDDFGNSSEVFQYSGRKYDADWQCPLHVNHGKFENNPAT